MTRKNELDAFLKVHESVDLKRLLAEDLAVRRVRQMGEGRSKDVYRLSKSACYGTI